MIAIDSSSIIAFISGETGKDVDAVVYALEMEQGVLPPIVLTEILSDPRLPKSISQIFLDLPLLDIRAGFWKRSGILRAKIFNVRKRARLADSLIAQVCIDYNCPLITRDKDFRAFSSSSNLKLFLDL
jgi:predicted nucleic acid-binding protein